MACHYEKNIRITLKTELLLVWGGALDSSFYVLFDKHCNIMPNDVQGMVIGGHGDN